MFAVTGRSTSIVARLEERRGRAVRINADLDVAGCSFDLPRPESVAHRYLLAAGYLAGKSLEDITAAELSATWLVNFVNTVRLATEIMRRDVLARICIIGSQSAVGGSYDAAYAGAKAALHQWATTVEVGPGRGLAVVAPPIIWDSGMTARRDDLGRIVHTRPWVWASDVADVVEGLLWSPGVMPRGVFTVVRGAP